MRITTSRRIIALLIVLMLVFSISISAAADLYSVKVTIRNGDTLYDLCKANGVDYYQFKEIIMRLNGITDEKKLDRLSVGDTIEIPASSADAAGMYQAANIKVYSENGAISVQHNPMANIVAGDASKGIAGDKPAYYIVSYTIEYGENLSDLYGAWGMKLENYSETIKLLNALSDLSYLPAGRTLYLPSANAGLGTVCYTVMEHTIVNGDTAFQICQSYGMNYDQALPTLQSFNPGMDLAKIIVNHKLYIPVNGMVTEQYVPQMPAGSAADEYAAYLAYVAQQVAQQPPQGQPEVLVPLSGEFNGFGVVISYGSLLTVRLENGEDYDLNVTPGALNGYFPQPGDYVKLNFSASNWLLNSIQYVYNVFKGC